MATKKPETIDEIIVDETEKEETIDAKEVNAKEKVEEPSLYPEQYMKERISYMAFKDDGKYKDDIPVIVNGHNFIIQRGVVVQLPRYVVAILESKDRELRAANIYLEEAIKAGRGL